MTTNKIYTYDYFQPTEYRFSLDSVFLAQSVASLIQHEKGLHDWKCLDLCAGCGIIGFELSLHSPSLKHFDFLEVQNVYHNYFDKNVKMIHPTRLENFNFLNQNYNILLNTNFKNHYDLIVSNPPYFFKNEGLLSPNDFKNRCRFFLDSDFKTLIESILWSLKPEASAYILARSGDQHGRNVLNDCQTIIANRASAQVVDNIRGTQIIQIRKES